MTRAATILLVVCLAVPAFGQIKSLNHELVPAADGDFVFVVAGDNRPTTHGAPFPHVLDTIVSEMRLIRPDLVLWTGDTVYGYGDKDRAELAAEYATFIRKAAHAGVPIFNAPGNHEVHPNVTPCDKPNVCEDEFISHFGALYGSFDDRGRPDVRTPRERRRLELHRRGDEGERRDVQHRRAGPLLRRRRGRRRLADQLQRRRHSGAADRSERSRHDRQVRRARLRPDARE